MYGMLYNVAGAVKHLLC